MNDPLRVLVASQNCVKAEAVQEGFERFWECDINVNTVSYEINSKVSDQPLSLEETALGAMNRLYAVKREVGYDYHVSIEGGAFTVDTAFGAQWFESACAAVRTQPPSSDVSLAYGPAYPIPPRLVRHLREGKDLNQAMEAETGIVEIGKSIGFNGWLTDGKLDRKSGSAQAVLMALAGLNKS